MCCIVLTISSPKSSCFWRKRWNLLCSTLESSKWFLCDFSSLKFVTDGSSGLEQLIFCNSPSLQHTMNDRKGILSGIIILEKTCHFWGRYPTSYFSSLFHQFLRIPATWNSFFSPCVCEISSCNVIRKKKHSKWLTLLHHRFNHQRHGEGTFRKEFVRWIHRHP